MSDILLSLADGQLADKEIIKKLITLRCAAMVLLSALWAGGPQFEWHCRLGLTLLYNASFFNDLSTSFI